MIEILSKADKSNYSRYCKIIEKKENNELIYIFVFSLIVTLILLGIYLIRSKEKNGQKTEQLLEKI
jgi:hypothetical protein